MTYPTTSMQHPDAPSTVEACVVAEKRDGFHGLPAEPTSKYRGGYENRRAAALENRGPLSPSETPQPDLTLTVTPHSRYVLFPLALVSNPREHHMARSRRVKAERLATLWALAATRTPKPELPCTVVLTRIAARDFDDDNLAGAFKGVRDAVADWLGVNDRRIDLVAWEYRQGHVSRKADHHVVEIAFEAYRVPVAIAA